MGISNESHSWFLAISHISHPHGDHCGCSNKRCRCHGNHWLCCEELVASDAPAAEKWMKNCLLISTCFRWNASLLITPPDQITRFFNEKSICCFSFAVSSRCTVTSLQGTSCVCWNLCSYLSREKKKFRNWTSQCNRWKMKATHVLWLAHFLFKNSIFFQQKLNASLQTLVDWLVLFHIFQLK